MPACLRCGIDVYREGVTCRDCNGVDLRLCNQLRAEAREKMKKKKAKDDLLTGLVYVGNTAKERQIIRDRGRKR